MAYLLIDGRDSTVVEVLIENNDETTARVLINKILADAMTTCICYSKRLGSAIFRPTTTKVSIIIQIDVVIYLPRSGGRYIPSRITRISRRLALLITPRNF